jgi:hypothetical protein
VSIKAESCDSAVLLALYAANGPLDSALILNEALADEAKTK